MLYNFGNDLADLALVTALLDDLKEYYQDDPTIVPRILYTFPNGFGASLIPDCLYKGKYEIALMFNVPISYDSKIIINGRNMDDVVRNLSIQDAVSMIREIYALPMKETSNED